MLFMEYEKASQWQDFWQEKESISDDLELLGDDSNVLAGGVADNGQLDVFWQEKILEILPMNENAAMLELACGSGSVLAIANRLQAVVSKKQLIQTQLVGLDISQNAINMLARKTSAVGVVSSAAITPFANGAFFLVCSQFGLEYAGKSAFTEAARLVAQNGTFLAIVHKKGSGIDIECQQNQRVLMEVLDSGLFEQANTAFSARNLFKLAQLEKQTALAEHRKFSDCFDRVSVSVYAIGEDIPAILYIKQILDGLMTLYNRLDDYNQADVHKWLSTQQASMRSYVDRMSSMQNAALAVDDVKQINIAMEQSGLIMEAPQSFRFDQQAKSAAWIVRGAK